MTPTEPIKAQELRIGNWLNKIKLSTEEKHYAHTDPLGNVEVYSIDFDGVNSWMSGDDCLSIPFDCFEPIPLTPEILEKAGFVTRVSPVIYEAVTKNLDKIVRIHKVDENRYSLGNYEGLSAPLHYLHQLQNLYYALTNTELEIKL